MGYMYFFKIIDPLIVLITVAGIFNFFSFICTFIVSSISNPFFIFKPLYSLEILSSIASFTSVTNFSIPFIFFLIISLKLFYLSKIYFLLLKSLKFSLTLLVYLFLLFLIRLAPFCYFFH